MTGVQQQNPGTGAWEPATPLAWAPGLDAEVSTDGQGHRWRLFWRTAELAHGTARTRAGLAVALARAGRRWRVSGPAVGALMELRTATQTGKIGEERLLDRRCRCSRPADQEIRDCLWHSSVSAQYARDLHQLIAELAKVPLPGGEPTPASSGGPTAVIFAAIRRAAAAGHTGGRTDRPRRLGKDA